MWKPGRFDPGDVIVFAIEGRGTPIVHRVVTEHVNRETDKISLLTKGDNNAVDDRGLYGHKQMFIGRDEVMGRVFGFLPYVGMITVLLNDYPAVKYIIMAC